MLRPGVRRRRGIHIPHPMTASSGSRRRNPGKGRRSGRWAPARGVRPRGHQRGIATPALRHVTVRARRLPLVALHVPLLALEAAQPRLAVQPALPGTRLWWPHGPLIGRASVRVWIENGDRTRVGVCISDFVRATGWGCTRKWGIRRTYIRRWGGFIPSYSSCLYEYSAQTILEFVRLAARNTGAGGAGVRFYCAMHRVQRFPSPCYAHVEPMLSDCIIHHVLSCS